jgi:hypothetical protein
MIAMTESSEAPRQEVVLEKGEESQASEMERSISSRMTLQVVRPLRTRSHGCKCYRSTMYGCHSLK